MLIWVTSAKLKHFIEPYYAPHNFNYRFVHAFFYLLFTFNISGNPSINLSAVALVTGDILFYKRNVGRIYQASAVDIGMVCYLNIFSFSILQLFVQQRRTSHDPSINYAAYLSGAVTFTLFVLVVIYHVYSALHTWFWQQDKLLEIKISVDMATGQRYQCLEHNRQCEVVY